MSDDFKQKQNYDDDKDERDSAAAVVANSRAHAVSAKAEDKNKNEEKNKHGRNSDQRDLRCDWFTQQTFGCGFKGMRQGKSAKSGCSKEFYGSLAASATGFQWSGPDLGPLRKMAGAYCLDSAALSWCDQGTRVEGNAAAPAECDSA